MVQEDYKNYYETLELSIDATNEEIHQGYVRAKNAFSGDTVALYSLMNKDECSKILDMIEEAYSILSVPAKKREYDQARGFNRMSSRDGDVGSEDSLMGALRERFRSRLTEQEQREQERVDSGIEPSIQSMMSASDLFNEQTRQQRASERANNLSMGEDFSLRRSEVEISKLSAQKRFSLDYKRDTVFEQKIENITVFTGEILKSVRDYKNVDVPRMSSMTKVSKTYIMNIENDEYDKLPALVYVRGFVYQYAKCLKLPPDLVATSYIHHLKDLKSS